jgi:hypothetical protein
MGVAMNPETKWNNALTVVARALIIISGLSLAGGIIGSFFCDCLMINLGDLLIIFAARGVLYRSESRRKLLLFFLWLQFSAFLLILLLWSRATVAPAVSASVRTVLFWIVLILTVFYAGCLFILHHPKVKAQCRTFAPAQDDSTDSERR